MLCPFCKTEINIPYCVQMNVASYHTAQTIAAPCCHRPLRVSVRTMYNVEPTTTNATEDNWGDPLKKPTDAELIAARTRPGQKAGGLLTN